MWKRHAMAVKAVIFDIGGVIVDVDLEGYAAIGARLFQCSPEDMRAAVQARIGKLEMGQLDSEGFWKEIGEALWSRGKGKLADAEECRGLWRKLIKEKMKVDLNMLNLCWSLQRRGVVVAALSNTIVDHAEHLAALGAYQPFRPCILSCQVGLRKPDPAIYELTAREAGVRPKECLFVDDLAVNVEGARAAGMQGFLFKDLAGLLVELGRHRLA